MVLQETGREGVDWINLAQDTDKWLALVNTGMKLRFPHNAGKCLSSRRTISSSTRTKLHWVGWMISQKRSVWSVKDFPYVSSVLINNSIIFKNRGKVTEFSLKNTEIAFLEFGIRFVRHDCKILKTKYNKTKSNSISRRTLSQHPAHNVSIQWCMKSSWVSDSVLTQWTSDTPGDVVATKQIDRLSPLQKWQCKHSTRRTLLRTRIINKVPNENSVHEFGVCFTFSLPVHITTNSPSYTSEY